MLTLPSRPQEIGKVLDLGFKLYVASFKQVVPFTFLAGLLHLMPTLLIPGLQSEDPEIMLAAMESVAAYLPLLLLPILFLYGMIIYRMGAILYGWDNRLSTCLRIASQRLLRIFLATILYIIAIVGGLFMFILPAVVISLTLFYYLFLIVLNGDGTIQSLINSHRLVWGNWWRTSIVLSIPMMILMAVVIMMSVIGITLFVGGATPESMQEFDFIRQTASLISNTVLTPLFYAIALAQLHDLKIRQLEKQGKLAELQQSVESGAAKPQQNSNKSDDDHFIA